LAIDGKSQTVNTELASIRQLLANGNTKVALDRAKQLHKDTPSPETEGVLLDAYAARVQALRRQGLTREAAGLLCLSVQRDMHIRLQAAEPIAEQTGN
jgi:hypothetical protein